MTNILITLIAVLIVYIIFLSARQRQLAEEIEARSFDRKQWGETRSLINNAILGKGLRDNFVKIVSLESVYSVWICRVVEKNNCTMHIDYVVKEFRYNPIDDADRQYAYNCAEELKEAIELDWELKTKEL